MAARENPVPERDTGCLLKVLGGHLMPSTVTLPTGRGQVRGLLAKMERIWLGSGKEVMQNPEAWIIDTVESVEL